MVVVAYYFVEKEREKKFKHRLGKCLNEYGNFLLQLIKLKDLNTHFHYYYLGHLKVFERLLGAEYPGDFSNGLGGWVETRLEGKEEE